MMLGLFNCSPKETEQTEQTEEVSKFAHPPLVSHMFTADPSAHVFEGKIYIYPSHDVETAV
ncbi:MAG: alpha-N-arabinofuranosidase, partial [Cyclobacteriaceae bacterium]|nr:alpha-N-arabinofuranosidase [Cyclobacteriaceae bacterium]